MDNLSNDLLTEIWCRVPYKIVVSCKSISKRFSALFSNPDFIKRSIYHSHTLLQHMKDEEREKEWYLNFVSEHKLLISSLPNIHLSNPQNQLSCHRKFNDALEKRVVLYPRIVGCSNGLLLCRTCGGSIYHVCNPVTRDRVILPPIPPPYNQSDTFEGFICEPHYKVEGNDNKVTLNLNGHRFRVVRFGKSMYEMVVFSSETGQWSEKLVSCSKGNVEKDKIFQPGVAHGGKIYFMRRKDVVVYDPFNNDEECHIINFPKRFWFWASFGHIGVCCGNIRIACFSITKNVCVWELEGEEEHCRWRRLHKFSFPDKHNLDSPISRSRYAVLAFHPHHGDVVFVQLQRAQCIYVANLKTQRLEIAEYQSQRHYYWRILPLDLPFWPTTIPSITPI